MKKYFLPFLFISLFATVSCKNDKGMVKATVIDTQDVTYIGCGYLLQLEDSALLLPLNLPSAYQHDGMPVLVKYKHTGIQDTCAYGTVIYDDINIEKIKRAL